MIDRTQLTEALAWWVDVVADVQTDTFTLTMSRTMARRTLSALERLLDFPTDEMMELLAGLISTIETVPAESHPENQLEIARAALEAIRQVMIKETSDT